MNGNKDYYRKEALRHLKLALIGAHGKCREHIKDAIDCLNKCQIKKEK